MRLYAKGWLAYALPLVLAAGCSLILATPMGQRQGGFKGSGRFADQSNMVAQPQPQPQPSTPTQRAPPHTPVPQNVHAQPAQASVQPHENQHHHQQQQFAPVPQQHQQQFASEQHQQHQQHQPQFAPQPQHQQQQHQQAWTENKVPVSRPQKPSVPNFVNRAPSHAEHYVDEREPMMHEEHHYPDEQHPPMQEHMDPIALARSLMQNGNGYAHALPSGGLNFNNHVSNINIGNSKRVNYANKGDLYMPKRGSNLFKSSRNQPGSSKAESFWNQYDDHFQPAQTPDVVTKEKATPEQKALKRKLLDLAEKATAAPEAGDQGTLLKFDSLTKQYVPVVADPNVQVYKKKLQDAIKALSAKKLPADKLRQALEGLEEEPAGSLGSKMVNERPSPNLYDGVFEEDPMPHEDDGLIVHEEENHDSDQSEQDLGEAPPMDNEEEPAHVSDVQVQEEEEEEPLDQDEQQQEQEPEPEPEPAEANPQELVEQDEHQEEPVQDDEGESDTSSVDGGDMLAHPNADEFDEVPPAQSHEHEQQVDLNLINQVREVLADRLNRVSDLLYFRPEFMNQLLHIQDEHLSPIEREFRRMILCNSDEQFCHPEWAHLEHGHEHDQSDSESLPDYEPESDSDSEADPHMHQEFEDPSQHYEPYDENHYDSSQNYYDEHEHGHEHESMSHMPPPSPHRGRPEHYSRRSSSFFYAQNDEHHSAALGPNGHVEVASTGPIQSSLSHAMSSVSDGQGVNTVVQQSVSGPTAEAAKPAPTSQPQPAEASGAQQRPNAVKVSSGRQNQEMQLPQFQIQPLQREHPQRLQSDPRGMFDYGIARQANQPGRAAKRAQKVRDCAKDDDGKCLNNRQQLEQLEEQMQQQMRQRQQLDQERREQLQQELQQHRQRREELASQGRRELEREIQEHQQRKEALSEESIQRIAQQIQEQQQRSQQLAAQSRQRLEQQMQQQRERNQQLAEQNRKQLEEQLQQEEERKQRLEQERQRQLEELLRQQRKKLKQLKN